MIARSKKTKPKKTKSKKAKPKKTKGFSLVISGESVATEQMDKENYVRIADVIKKSGKKCKCILFASTNRQCLPVTVPVNVAANLANAGKKCLLIDLDFMRDAVAKVFDLSDNGDMAIVGPKALPTDVENLYVWPSYQFTKFNHMNLAFIAAKAAESYDFVLLNAPSLITSCDRNLILKSADAVLTFSNSSVSPILDKLVSMSNCRVLGEISIQH